MTLNHDTAHCLRCTRNLDQSPGPAVSTSPSRPGFALAPGRLAALAELPSTPGPPSQAFERLDEFREWRYLHGLLRRIVALPGAILRCAEFYLGLSHRGRGIPDVMFNVVRAGHATMLAPPLAHITVHRLGLPFCFGTRFYPCRHPPLILLSYEIPSHTYEE